MLLLDFTTSCPVIILFSEERKQYLMPVSVDKFRYSQYNPYGFTLSRIKRNTPLVSTEELRFAEQTR